ncbi:serine/threonine-protein kinase [Streptomyces sp. NPDC050610]|uniref:serine/threonine-protein kinase n=1 Tax=Streptomyces sp. NPDC050610 TaxID=3157097 RepID=UPI003448022A
MGEVFAGRYELVDPIGRGGVGAVWRAWDQRRRRYVAAKVLQQSDAHTLLRFVREQALRIDHPHVLAPMSWAADDDKVLFTMDVVRGGSLAHLIGDYGPLPPVFVCTLLDQLLSGLTAVHAEGVVHRDIKPANILLEATGTGRPHLRLSDFGIAMRKGEPRLTDSNFVMGTPGYFAPEQMLGEEPDFPADLFAVGLVSLYLLTGRKPDAEALVQLFLDHGMPSAPSEVPEPLWQVIAHLLQPDPYARFRTATGARKALTAAVELLPEPAFDEEVIEVFDQLGPLPAGFGPDGPERTGRTTQTAQTAQTENRADRTDPGTEAGPRGEAPTPESAAPGPSMSDTGSFPFPLPGSTASQPRPAQQAQQTQQERQAQPSRQQAQQGQQQPPEQSQEQQLPHPPPHAPHTPQAPLPPAYPPTRPYSSPRPATPYRHAAARKRQPGPPPKVAVPVVIVALLCLAVGIWALSVS